MICPNCSIPTSRIEGGYKCPTCPFITFDNKKIITEIGVIVYTDDNGLEGMIAMDVNGVKMSAVNSNPEFVKNKMLPEVKKQVTPQMRDRLKVKVFKLVE